MPAINFTMFIDKILSGEKTQTIRKVRKNPIKVGDILYLYSGLRTKNAKLLKKVKCTDIKEIYIESHSKDVYLGDEFLNKKTYSPFVKADGFDDEYQFLEFLENTYPRDEDFEGVVIYWEELENGKD